MALRFLRSTPIIILILFLTSVPTGNVRALTNHTSASTLPFLDAFVEEIRNGHANELRGIYVPEVLADHIIQQPTGRNEFVSSWDNVVTQFGLATKFGSTGLLAHNYLAGENFSRLEKGKEIYLIYGNGQISAFVVAEILKYQALEPNSISSDFVDLATGDLLTAPELFSNVYGRPGQVILQTCISSDDNPSWGRLFIIAEPYLHKTQY